MSSTERRIATCESARYSLSGSKLKYNGHVWLFRGQAEGVSSSRKRGAEDSYPSQCDETTVRDCKTDD